MAFGMKTWIGVVAGACAALALWMLPPRTLTSAQRQQMAGRLLPEDHRYLDLLAEIQRAQGVVQATRWVDSLAPLALRTAVDGLVVGAPTSPDVSAEGLREWRDVLSDELDSGAVPRNRMTLGYYFQDSKQGAVLKEMPSLAGERVIYAGEREGAPYCLTVTAPAVPVSDYAIELESSRGLGPCELYARYGAAGAGVRPWLESGGLTFGNKRDRGSGRDAPIRTARLFGVDWMSEYTPEDAEILECLAGRGEACLVTVTDPRHLTWGSREAYVIAHSPAVTFVQSGWVWPFGRNTGYLFTDLEAQFGDDAFASFWSSDRPVPEAFQAAFGVGMAGWIGDWATHELGARRAGPMPPLNTLLFCALFLVAASGLVSAAQLRRRAG
jgi:hypothetical protein